MADIVSGVVSGALTRSEFGESDIDDYFENNTNAIHSRVVNLRATTQAVDGSSLIWGNTTYGIWGSFYWSGSMTTPYVRTREDYMWIDYDESFSGSQYANQSFNDLIGYFNFNNDVNDISGHNFNGSIGGATIGINNGVINKCLSFALGGSVVLPYVPSSNLSMSLWFKPDAVSSSNRNIIAYQKSLLLFKNSAFTWYPDVDVGGYTASATVTTGSWYHIVVSQVGTNYNMYLNGSIIGSGTAVPIDTANGYNYIGYYPGNINFSGSLDEFLLSSRGLNANEVHYLYNNGSGNTYFSPANGWGTGSIIFQNVSQTSTVSFVTGSKTSTIGSTSGSITLV